VADQICEFCREMVQEGASFCSSCGQRVSNSTTAALGIGDQPQTKKRFPSDSEELPLFKTRTFITTWIAPINATILFSGALVGFFDFLSPRIALLPGASIVAVLSTVGIIAVRHFVARHLPPEHKLYKLCAPGESITKAPAVLMTALLSLLLVTGTAWSTSKSSEGGFIASNFEAARDAQIQLGILKEMHRETTAKLEKIQTTLDEIANPSDARRALAQRSMTYGREALLKAVKDEDFEGIELLFKAGMEPDAPYIPNDLPIAFEIAVNERATSVKVLKLFMKAGFDPFKVYETRSKTPVSFVSRALARENTALVQYLVEIGANLNKIAYATIDGAIGSNGLNALDNVVRSPDIGWSCDDARDYEKNLNWIRFLVKSGADIDQTIRGIQSLKSHARALIGREVPARPYGSFVISEQLVAEGMRDCDRWIEILKSLR